MIVTSHYKDPSERNQYNGMSAKGFQRKHHICRGSKLPYSFPQKKMIWFRRKYDDFVESVVQKGKTCLEIGIFLVCVQIAEDVTSRTEDIFKKNQKEIG